jgi:hypothetical protein
MKVISYVGIITFLKTEISREKLRYMYMYFRS